MAAHLAPVRTGPAPSSGAGAVVDWRPALTDGWFAVLANDLKHQTVSRAARRFADGLDARLDRVADALSRHAWRPGHLTPVRLMTTQKTRQLLIPTIEDRVVARAVLSLSVARLDPHLGPAAYGYRHGLGVDDAVQAVIELRDQGLPWVLRADIRDCFDTLPRGLAVARFAELAATPDLAEVVARLAERTYRSRDQGWCVPEGLPQGCPLSPVLSNLALLDVDTTLLDAGYPTVRYSDDLTVLSPTREDAEYSLHLLTRVIESLGMSLNSDKTQIMSFDEGFSFLGEDFTSRYPSQTAPRGDQPVRRTLYIARPGARLSIGQGRIRIDSADQQQLLDVPQTQVGRVVSFGAVGISAGVRTWAMSTGVDVVLASRTGSYLGTLLSHKDRYRPVRLRAQLDFCNTPRALQLARTLVSAKVLKQRVLLQRANRRHAADATRMAIGSIDAIEKQVATADNTSQLLGYEGAAARAYFSCLGQLFPEPLRFATRSKRPPTDVINSALSFLYGVLLGECITALHSVGLEPSIGVLHSDDDNRPSLALDLMEEFRPLIVDTTVLRLAAHHELTGEHARLEGRATLLTSKGREVVLAGYERRMLQRTSALPGFTGTLRRHLYRQAQRLRTAVLTGEEWTGLSWR